MPYTIKHIDDQAVYEALLAEPRLKPHATFLHTWEWGETIQKRAISFERLGIYDDTSPIGVVQIGLHPLKMGGTFWYAPRGIAMEYGNAATVTEAYRTLSDYCKKKGGAFLRVDPDIVCNDPAEAAIDSLKPGQAAIFTQAERVWCADLQPTIDEQLSWLRTHGMRKNIPYYVRKSKKAGVTVTVSDTLEDLEKMIALLNNLNTRKGGIGKHNDEHYREQFSLLAPKGYEKVFLAEKDGQVLAGALITIFGREANYLHGASATIERELSAPHYLHLEIMRYCIEHRPEVERYNFWGIVGDKNRTPKHPRHGYSEFKRSFGGYKETYIRARDFRYNWFAWKLDWLVSKYRAWKHKND